MPKNDLELIIADSVSPPIVVDKLLAIVRPQRAVIDIGSGVHGPVGQQALEALPAHVELHCGDIFTVRDMPPRWNVHCPLDMREMFALRPGERWSWVQTFDTLEHIPKEDGEIWLDAAKHASRAVLVFVPTTKQPDGFMDNAEGEAAYPDNPYQKHLSGWVPADFERAGYTVGWWGKSSLFAFYWGD